jgi:glycosyltransferase involved in cell wall biosynthesis
MKNSELTIIIPAKNEAKAISNLLRSLERQTYKMYQVPIYLADAGSTDGTRELAVFMASRLNLLEFHVIKGGLPAVGRNYGAFNSASRYLLFLDADVELEDPTFIDRAVGEMRAKGLHCATTDIHCPKGSWKSRLAYAVNNFYQRGSRFVGTPFSTGMCMFFDRRVFEQLGGFNEEALFAEDYQLSKQVGWRRFRVIAGGITTSDRRFQKMGFWRLAKLFLQTALFSHKDSQFTKDHGYWDA